MPEATNNHQLFLNGLTEIILENLDNENFGVKELVERSSLSRYRLSRKLHAINKKTITQYIREVRLHKAMELLQKEELTASEVAYKVGFSSLAYLINAFMNILAIHPG